MKATHTILPVLLSVTLGAQIPGQIATHSLRTDGVVGVFAENDFALSRANQRIADQLRLTLFRTGAFASLQAAREGNGTRIQVLAVTPTNAEAGTTVDRTAATNPIRFVHTIAGSGALVGRLRVTYFGLASAGATLRGSVRSGGTTTRLTASGTARVAVIDPFIVPASGVDVTAELSLESKGASTSTWDVAIEFEPFTRVSASEETASCGVGGQLDARIRGTLANGDVSLDLRHSGVIGGTQWLLASLTAPTTPQPFLLPGCVLLDGFVPVQQRTGAAGTWQLPLTVGPSVQGTVRLQVLAAGTLLGGGPPVLATSNVLRITAR